jgi:hypothetical protein
MFPDSLLDEGDKLFDEAATLAQTPLQKEYVEKNRIGLRYVRLIMHPRNDDVFKQFVADVRKMGITNISEAQGVDAWEQQYLAQAAFKK